MARFRGRSAVGRAQARRLEWAGEGRLTQTDTTLGTSQLTILNNTSLTKFTDPTLTRIVGDIYVSMVANAMTSQALIVSLGIITAAPSVTFTSPGDATQTDRDWLWTWMSRLGTRGQNTAVWNGSAAVVVGAGANHAGDHFEKIHVDIRAQRRLRPLDQAYLVWNTGDLAGDPDFTIAAQLRCLIKE